MINRIKTNRGKQLLSSILLVGVIYLLTPTTFSYDKVSAIRLLLWLFAMQIFIYFGVVITISFVMKILKAKYSQKICSFIFSHSLNDMLILIMLITTLHIVFMLAAVNTIGVSYKWIVRGINFSVKLSVVDICVVIIYFLVLYRNSSPVNFLNTLLEALKKDLQKNNREEINEKLLILRQFIDSYPFRFNKNLLVPIFVNEEVIKLLSQFEKENKFLSGIFELIISVYFQLLNSHELKSAYKIFEIILEYKNNIDIRKVKFLIYQGIEKRKTLYLIKCIETSKSIGYFPLNRIFKRYLISIGFCKPNRKWAKRVVYMKCKK